MRSMSTDLTYCQSAVDPKLGGILEITVSAEGVFEVQLRYAQQIWETVSSDSQRGFPKEYDKSNKRIMGDSLPCETDERC